MNVLDWPRSQSDRELVAGLEKSVSELFFIKVIASIPFAVVFGVKRE